MGRSDHFDSFFLKLCHQLFLLFRITHNFHINQVCLFAFCNIYIAGSVILQRNGNISAFLTCPDCKKQWCFTKNFCQRFKHILAGFRIHQFFKEICTPFHQICSRFFRILCFLADFFSGGSSKRNADFRNSCSNGQVLYLNRFCHFLTSPFS